ncbi:MAG: MarC family protein [Bryobacteraceae bacterium]
MDQFLQVLIALLAITDPPGAVPIFLSLTTGMPPEVRAKAPLRAAVAVVVILAVALLAGEALLRLFGISLPAFQAAGGLLIVLMGLEMLRGSPTKVQDESKHEDDSEDRILVPLAMPLIAGPGSIATVITFAARRKAWTDNWQVAAAIVVVGVVVYLTLRSAAWLQRHISARGQRIFLRFMGLILVAIGAQLLLSGVHGFRP